MSYSITREPSSMRRLIFDEDGDLSDKVQDDCATESVTPIKQISRSRSMHEEQEWDGLVFETPSEHTPVSQTSETTLYNDIGMRAPANSTPAPKLKRMRSIHFPEHLNGFISTEQNNPLPFHNDIGVYVPEKYAPMPKLTKERMIYSSQHSEGFPFASESSSAEQSQSAHDSIPPRWGRSQRLRSSINLLSSGSFRVMVRYVSAKIRKIRNRAAQA